LLAAVVVVLYEVVAVVRVVIAPLVRFQLALVLL
jgi:hypothetical protein